MIRVRDLDPYAILGVSSGCSAEALREAYRAKTRKHHPDHGGDDWAFKIVVRAYEALSRVVEIEKLSAQTRSSPSTGRIRMGVQDKGLDPSRLVHVEMVWMRYEVGDVLELMAERPDSRNLSGSLQIRWPGEDLAEGAETLPLSEKILPALNAAFDELRKRTAPTGAGSRIERGCFDATLGYPSGQDAWEAFKLFHVGLKARGLGAKQWTRDVTIPRDHGA